MIFEVLRRQVKWIIVAVAVAFAVTLLYVGGPSLFRSVGRTEPAIARVNGESIDQTVFNQAFLNQVRAFEQRAGSVRPTQLEDLRYQALNQVIAARLLTQAARQEGIRVSRGEVDRRLAQVRDSFPSPEEFRRQLELRRMTERDLRRAIEENLMVEKLQEKLAEKVTVPDEEVARAYEQVRVRQILIRPEGTSEAAWRQAGTRAQSLYERLAGGARFEAVARAESDDESTRDQGGDLGFVSRGALPEPLDEAVFALGVGEISKPLRTELGYHIVQVTERREAKGEAFEQARGELAEQLKREKAGEAFGKWFDELRRQASVEIFDPQLAAREALARGDADSALKHYQKALEADPDNPYLHYGMARVLRSLGRQEEALAALETAVRLESQDPILQLELGNAYIQHKKDTKKAAEALRQASQLAPMDLQIHLALYAMFSNLGLKEDAARELKEVEKIQQVLDQQRRLQEEFFRRLQEQQANPEQPQGQDGQTSSGSTGSSSSGERPAETAAPQGTGGK